MDQWAALPELERYKHALRLPCPRCQARHYRDCTALGDEDQRHGGTLRRHTWTGIVSMHTEREQYAKQEYEAEQRDLAAQIASQKRIEADEVARTCPWCGFLAPSAKELLEHEDDCDG